MRVVCTVHVCRLPSERSPPAVSVEETLLAAARAVGLEDELNAANWQELLRWYICSKLDAASVVELNARQKALGVDTSQAGSAEPAPAPATKDVKVCASGGAVSGWSCMHADWCLMFRRSLLRRTRNLTAEVMQMLRLAPLQRPLARGLTAVKLW